MYPGTCGFTAGCFLSKKREHLPHLAGRQPRINKLDDPGFGSGKRSINLGILGLFSPLVVGKDKEIHSHQAALRNYPQESPMLRSFEGNSKNTIWKRWSWTYLEASGTFHATCANLLNTVSIHLKSYVCIDIPKNDYILR